MSNNSPDPSIDSNDAFPHTRLTAVAEDRLSRFDGSLTMDEESQQIQAQEQQMQEEKDGHDHSAPAATAKKRKRSVDRDKIGARPDSVASDECPLPEDFTPGDDDVICGRGKKCYKHIGNERFRHRVHLMLDEYRQAKNKLDKSNVLYRIVDQVRHQSPSGGFVKQDENTGRWYEVGDFLAREKTSQAFRDALHERYKSSNVSKKNRRREEQARASDVYSRIARDNRLEQLSQEIFQQHGVRYESARVGQLTEDFIRQNFVGSEHVLPIDAVARAQSARIRERSQFHQQPTRDFASLPSYNTSDPRRQLQEERGRQIREERERQQRQQFFQRQSSQPRSLPNLNTMPMGHRGAFTSMTNNRGCPDNLYGTSILNSPDSLSAAPSVRNFSPRGYAIGLGRDHSFRSDPGPHRETAIRPRPDMTAFEDVRLYQSEPDIQIEEPLYGTDLFQDREMFQRYYHSSPNINFPGEIIARDQSHQNIPINHEHMILPPSDSYHQERISLNQRGPMIQQDMMVLVNRPTTVGEFDPIPLVDLKMPAKKQPLDSSLIPTNVKMKAEILNNSNSSSSSGVSSSTISGILSKELIDYFGDDNPFEPVPISHEPTNRSSRTRKVNSDVPNRQVDDLSGNEHSDFGEV